MIRWRKRINRLKTKLRAFTEVLISLWKIPFGATVGQAKKLMNNLVSEIKEFVKGGEFENS